jgi:serine protease Do
MIDFSSFPSSFLTSENKAKFLIQDPFGLREVIQPVVSISQVEDRIRGLGTCFQISPWTWMTAQHVVSDNAGGPFPEHEVGAVGFSPGLIFGTVGFTTTDYFGDITEIYVAKEKTSVVSSFLPGPIVKPIVFDVATLKVNTAGLKKQPLISPLPLATSQPKIGDELIGIGFPILGSSYGGENAIMKFEERMFGASGIVRALHPQGVSKGRPWPTIEIEGDWESGMSGGPVVDLQGRIVGVISRSLAPTGEQPGIGWAVDLTQIPTTLFAPEIDPENPGWSRGWGTFAGGAMTGFFETKEKAKVYLDATHADEIKPVTHCPKTDNWIEL